MILNKKFLIPGVAIVTIGMGAPLALYAAEEDSASATVTDSQPHKHTAECGHPISEMSIDIAEQCIKARHGKATLDQAAQAKCGNSQSQRFRGAHLRNPKGYDMPDPAVAKGKWRVNAVELPEAAGGGSPGKPAGTPGKS